MSIGFLKREGFDYISNFYRYKLFDKKTMHYLITTDDGGFLFVNRSSFLQLKKGKILDERTFQILESKGIIVTPENFENIVEKTKKRYSFLQNGTSLHIVIPTHRCNLGCIYCFAEAKEPTDIKSEDMTDETAIKIVEFILKSPSHAITIEFQGGEPLIAFDKIKLMVLKAKELNQKYQKDLRLALVSNLTLMTDEIANWLIDNGVTICTSLDGPKEVHDKNRPYLAKKNIQIGTYEKVAYWIKKINSIYREKNLDLQVNAVMTITKYSLPYYKEIIDEYVKFNIGLVNIRPLTKIGRADENKESIYYSDEEFFDFYLKSIKYIETLNKAYIYVTDRMLDLYRTKIFENKPGYHADFESPCGAATGNITYFTDGGIYTCNEALDREEFKLGDVYENTWQEIFKKKETAKAVLNSLLENNVICDRCVYKPYCGTCEVENFYNFGKFNFYPHKTNKHHYTLFICDHFFNETFKEVKKLL